MYERNSVKKGEKILEKVRSLNETIIDYLSPFFIIACIFLLAMTLIGIIINEFGIIKIKPPYDMYLFIALFIPPALIIFVYAINFIIYTIILEFTMMLELHKSRKNKTPHGLKEKR